MIEGNIFNTADFKFCHITIADFDGGITERYQVDGLKKGDFLSADITYPLSKPAHVILTWNENRYDLAAQICREYRRIYKEEDESSEIEAKRICDESPESNLINRNKTNGKYGIWGHGIRDLVIEGLVINPIQKTVFLYIGS